MFFKSKLKKELKKKSEYYQEWVDTLHDEKTDLVENRGYAYDSDYVQHKHSQVQYYKGARNAVDDILKRL